MKRKIYSRFIILSLISILLTTVVLTVVFYGILKKQVFDDLKNSSEIVCSLLQKEKSFPDFSSEKLRITLVRSDGSVLYDSQASAESLENHLSRPEISEALQKGFSSIIRESDTLSESLFYYAVRLDNGNVLRIGKPASNVIAILWSVSPALLFTLLVIFLLSVVLSNFLTREIVLPIEKMADNLDSVEINPGYRELLPFAKKIRSQHDTILSTVNMRQEFTANVSHELKTPLTAISGYAELIENGLSDSETNRHFAEEIRKNASRLLDLINDILKLSELDVIGKNTGTEQTDLAEIAKNTVEMLQIEAQKNNIHLIYEDGKASSPEQLVVSISKEYAQELCYNLIQNAIRYNKKNGTVNVSCKGSLTVSDTGIGIPLEAQNRIFERFYRVDKSRSKELGGTGLGLAIVKHICEITEGTISLESKLGVGTTISIKWN